MKKNQVDRAVRQAFTHAAPDVLDCVLSDCAEQKGTVIVMTEKKRIPWGVRVAAMAAALALVIGVGFGAGSYRLNNTVASTISLDVNPSIEIEVNRNERVLDVDALNEDAEIVLDDMDLEGSDLNVAVNAIIGSMLRNGYISELANSILISVDSKDVAEGAALQEKLAAEVNKLLHTQTFDGSVLSQTVVHESALEKKAAEYGITLGKAQLIERITQQGTTHTFEELARLSIHELNLLMGDSKTPVENVNTVGTPSEKKYIGRDAAKAAAFAHAGVTEETVTRATVEMDMDDGVMVYDVEFTADCWEYEYEIHAVDGTVLTSEKEFDGEQQQTPQKPDGDIGKDLAVQTALQHASLSRDQVTNLRCERDEDDGKAYYEVTFCAGGYEYEYEVGAYEPRVLSFDKETMDDDDVPATQPAEVKVSAEEAKAAALQHASLTAEQVKNVTCEKEEDDGVVYYEISFTADGFEYDYEISAADGKVLSSEKEAND